MLSLSQRYRLEYQHTGIEEISSKLNLENLNSNEPGKWSIKDQIAHLAAYQIVFLDRLKLIVSTPEPLFTPYVADNDPEFPNWQKLELQELNEELIKGRAVIFSYVVNLTDEQANRVGVHPVYGKLTLTDWVEFFLLHEAHHIFSIFKMFHNTAK